MKSGYVYILVNPSMPDWIKIGNAADVNDRVRHLNNKTAVPLKFRIYATLQVDDCEAVENNIHSLIDAVDDTLRARENTKTLKKARKREFFKMSPENAFRIFGVVVGMMKLPQESLVRVMPGEEEQMEEDVANIARRDKMTFKQLHIPIGSELTFLYDDTKKCIVVDDVRGVEYNGESISMSALAQQLTGYKHRPQGSAFWVYKGETLLARRLRMEKES